MRGAGSADLQVKRETAIDLLCLLWVSSVMVVTTCLLGMLVNAAADVRPVNPAVFVATLLVDLLLLSPLHPCCLRELKSAGIDYPKKWPFAPFGLERSRRRAESTHTQTPERLAERGGLDVREALAILRDVSYFDLPALTDEQALAALADELTAALCGALEPTALPSCREAATTRLCLLARDHPGEHDFILPAGTWTPEGEGRPAEARAVEAHGPCHQLDEGADGRVSGRCRLHRGHSGGHLYREERP